MPHLRIEYTAQLDADTDMGALCQSLATVLAAQRDEKGQPVFPLHGTRILAFPAPHFAVADGRPEAAFVYMHLRVAPGRSPAIKEAVGQAMLDATRAHLQAVFDRRPLGLTVQVEDGLPDFDGKHNNILGWLQR